MGDRTGPRLTPRADILWSPRLWAEEEVSAPPWGMGPWGLYDKMCSTQSHTHPRLENRGWDACRVPSIPATLSLNAQGSHARWVACGEAEAPLHGPPLSSSCREPSPASPRVPEPVSHPQPLIGLPLSLKEGLRHPHTSPFSETMGCSKLRTQGQPSPKGHRWLPAMVRPV